jgi:anti-sigma factor RsiW
MPPALRGNRRAVAGIEARSSEDPVLTCRELIDFLAAYLDGELAPEVRALFEAHLSLCPDCVAYVASYRETIRLGKQACEPDAELLAGVPRELVDSIVAARRGGSRPRRAR